MRRILFAVVWTVVIYFGACFLVGAVAGAIAGANDPQNGAEAGARAGASAVLALRELLLLTAIFIGIVGAWLRHLPGTRLKRPGAAKTNPGSIAGQASADANLRSRNESSGPA